MYYKNRMKYLEKIPSVIFLTWIKKEKYLYYNKTTNSYRWSKTNEKNIFLTDIYTLIFPDSFIWELVYFAK